MKKDDHDSKSAGFSTGQFLAEFQWFARGIRQNVLMGNFIVADALCSLSMTAPRLALPKPRWQNAVTDRDVMYSNGGSKHVVIHVDFTK